MPFKIPFPGRVPVPYQQNADHSVRLQNGRVSPRKYSGASDKGSTSPAYSTQVSATKEEERVGKTLAKNGGTVGGGIVPALIKQQSSSSNTGTDSWRGSLPPKIEEAPNEANVLPT